MMLIALTISKYYRIRAGRLQYPAERIVDMNNNNLGEFLGLYANVYSELEKLQETVNEHLDADSENITSTDVYKAKKLLIHLKRANRLYNTDELNMASTPIKSRMIHN